MNNLIEMTSWREAVRIALLSVISIQTSWGASSALDFARFIQGPPAQSGDSIASDQAGFIYAAGMTESPANFPVTPGALRIIPDSKGPTVFLQKFSADGSRVLVSALLGGTGFSGNQVRVKVDASGNVYVAFPLWNYVNDGTHWLGDPGGQIAVLKLDSGGGKVLYRSRVYPFSVGPIALALDSDGSVYVAGDTYFNAQVWKLDPTGNPANYSYTFTETPAPGRTSYDQRSVGLAVLEDHSIYVMASPSFLYRLDPTGKAVLERANIGDGHVQLWNLAADNAGNAFVSGTAISEYAVTSNQIGFASSPATASGLIVKLDPSASVIYSDLFPVDAVTALAVDPTRNVWAGGVSASGFTLFQLAAEGRELLHYVSLAAPVPTPVVDNQLNALCFDNQGRLLVAGSTTAIEFPGFNRWRNTSASSDNQNQNAFFLRVSSNPPQTDLQLSVTASPAAATIYQTVRYTARIANAGAAPANDVLLRLPRFSVGSVLDNPDIVSCQAASQGTCYQTNSDWIIAIPQIASGETASVELALFIPAVLISPLHYPLMVLSSTDDPNQVNNLAASDVVIEPPALTASVNVTSPFVIDVPGVAGGIPIGCFSGGFVCSNGVPVVSGSVARIYIRTPQWSYGTLYEFAAWGDGSTENPRTFPAGTTQVRFAMRPVTEPWTDADSGIVNSAGYRGGAVSPGEIVALGGVNLGPAKLQTAQLDSQGRIATEVSGFQVLFDDSPAPIVYTSALYSAVIVPYSVAGKQTVQMTIRYQEKASTPVPITVAAAAPGLFSANSSGAGLLAAYNSDSSLNTRSHPASRGDVVVLFATGEGLTNPTPPDGQIAGASPPQPQLPVTVTIGGQPAEIVYRGGVPGVTAGVMQLNVRVPPTIQPGLLPVSVTVGTHSSQTGATLAIQ